MTSWCVRFLPPPPRTFLHPPIQIAQLESQRDLSQYIVHVDMDAFFANVELLDKPELASKPFAVRETLIAR